MSVKRPPRGWLDALPAGRLLVEVSLWSADLARLGDELRRIEAYADILHIDAADGHFAPALLFFPDMVARVRGLTSLPIHVHLMVADEILLHQVRQFAEAGADVISVHTENGPLVDRAYELIEARGSKPGVVLCTETPVSQITRHLGRVRFVTLLGTPIGVKGQGLAQDATARLREARATIAGAGQNRRIVLAADGGIRENTVPLLRAAGAETIVAGSLVFEAPDLERRIRWLRELPAPGNR
jgi:ribulose-phosphate 3-epimerase